MAMMRAVLVVALIASCVMVAVSAESNMAGDFSQWQAQHGVRYVNEFERIYRFGVFSANVIRIAQHNAQPNKSFTMAINQFADRTPAEFVAREKTGSARVRNPANLATTVDQVNTPLAAELDWRKRGVVTPVSDQGQCGSSWAFTAVGTLEGAHAIAKGNLTALSVQEVLDCTGQGCSGGFPDDVLGWAVAHGVCSAKDYPYVAHSGDCQSSKCVPVAYFSGYKDVTKEDEDALMTAVNLGPVSGAVDASSAFQFYSGGVLSDGCSTQVNHAVLIVGYGTEAGKDYWILKNSWGTSWGEAGYIRILRGKNLCGINEEASYAISA